MIIKLYYKAILYSLYKAISLYQIFDFWARRHILSMRGMMMPYSATVIELPFHSVLTSSMSIGEGWLHVKIGKFWRMVSILMVIRDVQWNSTKYIRRRRLLSNSQWKSFQRHFQPASENHCSSYLTKRKELNEETILASQWFDF